MFCKTGKYSRIIVIFIGMLLFALMPSSVANSANGWTPPIPVSRTVGTSYTPHLAVDSHGTVHMIWLDWVDLKPHTPYILYANKPAGGNWTSFSYLPGKPTFSESAIAVGPDDKIHIVWSAAGDGTIFYVSRTVSGSWSGVQLVSSGLEGNSYPDVAVDLNGTVHVAWNYGNVFDQDNRGIYYSMKSGSTWGSPVRIYQNRYATNCLIESDIYGVHVLMRSYETNDEVRYVYKPTDEGWSSPQLLSSSMYLQSVEQLAGDGQTKLYLVWAQSDNITCSLNFMTFTNKPEGGSWSGPGTVVSGNCQDVDINAPSITVSPQGHPLAAWSSRLWDDGEEKYFYSIWYAFSDGGGGWSGKTLIHDRMTYAYASSIAVDSLGGHHVVWDTGPAPAYPGEIFYAYREEPPEFPVTVIITPSGGTLQSATGDVRIDFPAGAVDEDVKVTFTRASTRPTGNLAGIIFFDLSAKTVDDETPVTSFDPPYTITINYGIEGPGPTFEDTLSLYFWDDKTQSWIEEDCNLNMGLNTITASLNHMTLFAVLGETLHSYLPMVVR